MIRRTALMLGLAAALSPVLPALAQSRALTPEEQQLINEINAHNTAIRTMVGRFLQIDPLAGSVRAPQTLNRYSYVAGNPLGYIDPTGRNLQHTPASLCTWDGETLTCPGFNVPTEAGGTATAYIPGVYTGPGENQGGAGGGWSGGGGGTSGGGGGGPETDDDPEGPDNGPEDPPDNEECAQLSPAEARYLSSWNSYDSTLNSMLADIGEAKEGLYLHMGGTAIMYGAGFAGAGALGYGLQVGPSAPVSLILGDSSGFWASRLGQALFRPGSFLNASGRQTWRIGISGTGGKWVFRAAGTKFARWAGKDGHAFEKVICRK